MKILLPILLAVLPFSISATECGGEAVAKLESLIKSGQLVISQNTTDNHKKLTEHDYPVACEVSYNDNKYKIYTDSKGKCLIIEDLNEVGSDYYGVYCS